MAQSTHTLRVSDDNTIKEVLRYVMILVGIRGNNLPTDEEKIVLLNFVKSNFGNQTVLEIKMAFEMATSGKFNIDAKCYENFSCEYFGRIINAFIEYSKEEIKNLPKQIEPVKEKPSDQELKKQAIDTANNYADQIRYCNLNEKKHSFPAGGLPYLFDYLDSFGIPVITETEWQDLLEKNKGIKNVQERMFFCAEIAYINFINQLVTFDCYIDDQGNIKPNEK